MVKNHYKQKIKIMDKQKVIDSLSERNDDLILNV